MALQAVSPESQPVVVTGTARPDPKAAQSFVHDVTQRSFDQVARFHDPLCPMILGLELKSAKVVRDRILETARGVGAQVDPSDHCLANLVLVIPENGSDFVRELRTKRPDWLQGLNPVDVSHLIGQAAPARAWSMTSIRDENGLNPATPDYGDAYSVIVRSASIINLPTRVHIESSVIVIDRAAVMGVSLAQLADYAAMRGLARTIPPKEQGVRTILNLFEPGSPREPELTRSDIVYLQVLYQSKGTENAVKERARLARALSAK